ncbi:hypothetical protein EST38_g9028 [Candolleomyces aberdarensis]|uniref:F-box domain-containing protein n=1 Tax=Candolleomyces aberdarensis TaxID=2316362 RepID=A0A4Q2DDV9_9AGAR|nr:hypothetical protein EST38_g9028 [Candolleomyces aberdarensis]
MPGSSGKEPSASLYNIDSVPDDVWLFLFEYLTTPDLSSVSKASKKFYALTQRPLLRELTWAKATGTLRNVQDWGDGAVLEQFRGVVRKVNVKLSYKKVNQHSALLLPVDWELYDAVHHRLLSFSNLRSLDLCGTIITPALYPVLEEIPSLRELSLIRCTFIWTYMYSPLLTNLGRQTPNQGLFVYNSANRSLSHQHGLIRAPSDPAQRAQQQTWLVENTVFDFTTRLSHITSLSLQCNRFTSHSSETDDLPYPPSEISRPCILHPLYLLSIPSLTHLTLTWTPTLAQVYDTLKQRFNFSGGGQNGNNTANAGAPGAVNAQAQHQFATLLFAANTLGMNLFTPLVVTLGQLTHATVIIEDLSRDMMESISGLFEQRIRNVTQGLAPLRIHLRVGKHTLTEQNMGSSHFRLPGVYKYEGPLPIAGLLANEGAADMEEVVMNEAMEMTSLLTTLARLPGTLKKLDIRMFCWDREILYAVHSLFRGLNELVVRYGREELEENTYVVLGSDILPDLKSLHTIKLIPSIECIKRDTQFRYPYPGAGHFHHFHGSHWWQQGGGHGHGGHPGGGGGGGPGGVGAFPSAGPAAPGGVASSIGPSLQLQQDYATAPMDPIDINDYDLYDFGDEDLYYAISRVPPAHHATSGGQAVASTSGSGSGSVAGVGVGGSAVGAGAATTANQGGGGGGGSSGAADTVMEQDDDASSTSSEASAPPSPAVTPGASQASSDSTMADHTNNIHNNGNGTFGGPGVGSGGNATTTNFGLPTFPNRGWGWLLVLLLLVLTFALGVQCAGGELG